MKKYQSLIFRELKISKRDHIAHVLLMLGFAAMLLVAVFGAWQQDAAAMSPEDLSEIHASLGMFSLMFSLLSAILAANDTNIYQSDINSGWKRYSYVLPITAKEKAIAHYAVKTAAILIGGVICAVFSAVIGKPFGFVFIAGALNLYLIVLDGLLIVDLLHSALRAAGWAEKQIKLLDMGFMTLVFGGGVIGILCALGFGGMLEKLEALASDDPFAMERFMLRALDTVKGLSVMPALLLIGLLTGCCLAAAKLYERREP